jgi:hypothetical protein
MEAAAGVEYDSRGYVKAGCPTVITYADDFVAHVTTAVRPRRYGTG